MNQDQKHYFIFGLLTALVPASVLLGVLSSAFYWSRYEQTAINCAAMNNQLMAQYQAVFNTPITEVKDEIAKPRKKVAIKSIANQSEAKNY
jgi:hypothetical protein